MRPFQLKVATHGVGDPSYSDGFIDYNKWCACVMYGFDWGDSFFRILSSLHGNWLIYVLLLEGCKSLLLDQSLTKVYWYSFQVPECVLSQTYVKIWWLLWSSWWYVLSRNKEYMGTRWPSDPCSHWSMFMRYVPCLSISIYIKLFLRF